MQQDRYEDMKNDHTFVVLAYKESKYLEECVVSVLNQNLKSKVIIATSTKNDFIVDIAKKYGLETIENTHPEKGIAQDFEFALSCANTNLVTIAHQDDIYEKDYLEEVLRKMDDKKSIAFTNYAEIKNGEVATTNSNLFIKKMLLFPLRFKALQGMKFFKRGCLYFGNPICCPTVTFNRRMIATPLFISNFRSNMDWYAWEKLSRTSGSFVYISESLMLHRIHEGSTTSEMINDDKRSVEDYEMFRLFWPELIARIITKIYKRSEKNNG